MDLKKELQDSAFKKAMDQLDLPSILAMQIALSQQALMLALNPPKPKEANILVPNKKLIT